MALAANVRQGSALLLTVTGPHLDPCRSLPDLIRPKMIARPRLLASARPVPNYGFCFWPERKVDCVCSRRAQLIPSAVRRYKRDVTRRRLGPPGFPSRYRSIYVIGAGSSPTADSLCDICDSKGPFGSQITSLQAK